MVQKGIMTLNSGNVLGTQFQASSLSLWPGYRFEIQSGFAGEIR
jgi:hypothetical protein